MAHDFFLWWGQQLLSLFPARYFEKATPDTDALLISPMDDFGDGSTGTLALIARQNGRSSRQGIFSRAPSGLSRLAAEIDGKMRKRPVFLTLPAGDFLQKTLVLPSAVEPDLDRVLHYEMDVETPFRAGQVYWNWKILARDTLAGKIDVALCLLPRQKVDGLLDEMRRAGIQAKEILAPLGDRTILLPLIRASGRASRPSALRPGIAWAFCLALAVVSAGLPFALQALKGHAIDARIAALRPDAMAAQDLLARLDGSGAGGNVIQAERERLADPLRVLNDLTEALPDDTFISDLLLKGRKLTVAGQSSSATRLIGLLSAQPLFRDPSFASPLTRRTWGNGSMDVFSISMGIGTSR